jgi:P-type Cu2+ transporter
MTSMNQPASPTSVHQVKLSITGMHCSACHQIIAFRLKGTRGVTHFEINVTSHTADVVWDAQIINLASILEAISSLGYGALPIGSSGELINHEHKMNVWRLFVAGFAMMQVMMYALPAYLEPIPHIDGDLTPDIDYLLKLASLALTIPVIIFSASPFFSSALRDLRNRHVGMDVPVSVGILVTFIGSLWATFSGKPVYYDSLIMFVFLLLAARMIQSRVHAKSTSALKVLTQLLPMLADKLPDYPHSMRVEQINPSVLSIGDTLLVQPGAKIPVDGIVISGTSECDESLMTGESRAVAKTTGSNLIGGAMNLNRPLVMRALRVGDETMLSSLVRMMETAAREKPPLVQLADRYASLFLTTILLLSIVSGLVWWQIEPDRAIWIAVTIMVITCPCALSLATPGVMSATIGQLAKQGVLIARGRAIESLARASHFVFDKTGTLTQGRLQLAHTLILRKDSSLSPETAAQITAHLTAGSTHPVARALFTAFSSTSELNTNLAISPYEEVDETAGQGIEARHHGQLYRLGSLAFVQALNGLSLEIPQNLKGKTLSALGDATGYIALYALEDTLRHDANKLVTLLLQQGKTVMILSGDRKDVVSETGIKLGISTALGELSPEAKHDIVKELQGKGATVAMIGDGMNDGPVLSIANVSIAMGQGAPISQARSDMVLISNDLRDLAYAINITAKSLSLIRQNIAWAVLYNIIAVPAAMAGILAPWHAAVGMSVSSILVVVNALRVYTIKSVHRPDGPIFQVESGNPINS